MMISRFTRTMTLTVRSFLVILLLLLACSVSHAATLYMGSGETYTNLQAAMAAMDAGDTLIIKDGTYTGATNAIDSTHKPPNGTAEAYTIVQAETDGGVIIDGEYTNSMFDLQDCSYIRFEGIIWGKDSGTVVTVGSVTEPHHIIFSKCGVFDGGQFNASSDERFDGFSVSYSHHILFQDCFAYGNMRYAFYAANTAQQLLYRRCMARIDSCNTETDISGFMVYDSRQVEIQNCIVIDLSSSSSYYLEANAATTPFSFYVRDTESGYDVSDIYFRGCIALNNPLGYLMIGASGGMATGSVSVTDTVLWDALYGAWIRCNNVSFDHCTIGTVDGTAGTSGSQGVYMETADEEVANSIIYDINGDYGLRAGAAWSASDYNCLYGNAANYSALVTPGAHDITATDPTAGSLEYLCRIETGSALKGAGSTGDIGATIVYKIGTDDTFYGDTGYATTTGNALWPFPEEALIRTAMRAYTATGIDSDRGFCADGMTLTNYILGYLGNSASGYYGSTATHSAGGTAGWR